MAISDGNHPAVTPAFLEKFPAWRDFPSGLHAVMVDPDKEALRHTQAQLEACNYAVTTFSDGQVALQALQDPSKFFHLAIVEVNPSNADDAFNMIRLAKHLPTILLSSTKDVNIMMEGIAAGASEFIEKPLSVDKVKNLWQHVFRKALMSGQLAPPHQALSDASETSDNVDQSLLHAKEVSKEVPHLLQHIKEEPGGVGETNLTAIQMEDFLPHLTMIESDSKTTHKLSFLEDIKPHCDVGYYNAKSPGPPTPQLGCAAQRRMNISDDESPLSQDFACAQSGCEEASSTNDCSSFGNAKSEMEDMDGLFQCVSDGDEFQSFADFDGLEAALNEDDDMKVHDQLDYQSRLSLADDLVDELSSCIDMDTSIIGGLPCSDDSFHLTLDCVDEGDHPDEEALLLAEVAKVEAGIVNSGAYMATSSSGSNIGTYDKKSSQNNDERHLGKASKSIHSKKKSKQVDWTPELHRRFVQAVEQLGVDKAIPSRILEIMGAQHLTRHNIASHLQKYRSHKKHMHSREAEAATWNQRRHLETVTRSPQPQIVSRPPPLVVMGLHVWGHPPNEHYWPKPWQPSDGSVFHQPPPVCLDAWGHPASGAPFFHPPHGHPPPPMLRLPLAPISNHVLPIHTYAEKMSGLTPPKDKVDAAVNEVLKNPFTPLPLGLKPPSLESILSELQRQGIKTVPPTSS